MKLHERHQTVTAARIEMGQAVTAAISKHTLTYAELFHILASITAQWAGYAVRDERQEASKKGKKP